jgi:hypothetical protein
MNRKRRLPKNTTSKVQKRYQTKIKLMKLRALKMMVPTRLMMKRSNQETPMKDQMKEKVLKWVMMVIVLNFCQPIQASTTLTLVPPPNPDKLVRHKNLCMILKACLKLRLVVQI